MSESKKVQSQSIISDDLFIQATENTKAFETEINKLIIGLKEVNKETTKTLKANKDPKTAEQIKVVTKALDDKKKVDEAIIKLQEKEFALAEKRRKLTNEEIKNQTVAKQLAKDRKAELEALAIIESHLIGTEQKLLATQTLLRLERKKLNEADKDYAVNLARINKSLDENNAKISANSDKLKQNQMNVGNYTDSMREAINSSNLFSKATGQLSESNQELVVGLSEGVKGLKNIGSELKNAEGFSKKAGIAMKALAIGAIISTLKGIKSTFESTGAGADKLKEQVAGLGGTLQVFTDRLADWGKGTIEQLSGLFTLNWERFNKGGNDAIHSFSGVTEQMGKAYDAGIKLQKMLNEYEKTLRTTRIAQHELNLDEEDFNEISSDGTRGIQEQREALEKAIEARKKSAKLGVEIAGIELKQQRETLIFQVQNQKQTKQTAEAIAVLKKKDLTEAFKNTSVLKLLHADELNLLEEKVKANLDAEDKLADLPRQEAMRLRASIQAQTAFEIDLIQKKKLNAGSEVAIITKKIADEKVQLLDREIFISNLQKAEQKSTDEQARIFNEGLRKENEVNKNNEAKQKKLVDFNDLIATKDEVILGHKLKALQLTEAQTEQTAKIVKDAQTNQIANDELILKLQNDKIASLERQFKLQNDLVSLQKQSEIDILKEQETEKQKLLDDSNTKILEGENVNNQIMIDYRKQAYEATVKYLDLEYEARELQLKRNAVLAKIENDKIVEPEERRLANQKIDEQYKIDSDKLERERQKVQLENSEKNDAKEKEIAKRRIQLENEKTAALVKDIQSITSTVSQELDNQFALQNNARSKEIEKQKTTIERQEELAKEGKANTLAYEEQLLAKRELAEKEALEKQAKIKEYEQLGQIFMSSYESRLKGEKPETAFQDALRDAGLSLAGKKTAQALAGSFIDGTEGDKTLGEMLGRTNTQDGHLILADDDERIFNPKQTSKIKGFTNDQVADAMFDIKNNRLPVLTSNNQKQDTASNIYASMILQTNAMIEKKLDALIAKPHQFIHKDVIGNIVETIKSGNQIKQTTYLPKKRLK